MLEALYEPDLGPEELFETMSQAFLNAVDRDAISGWGVVSYVMYFFIPLFERVNGWLMVVRKIRLLRDICRDGWINFALRSIECRRFVAHFLI
jgi:hypothetical protein